MPNPRIALFLGAGASVPYGKPTTAMFRNELQDAFGNGSALHDMLNSDDLPDIEYVLQAGYDILNHDKMVGGKHFKWLNEHGKISFQMGSYNAFIESVKDGISDLEELFFSRYEWDSDYDEELALLENILGFLFYADPHAYVFTTNYDTAVERYCKNKPVEIVDGFKLDEQFQCFAWHGFSESDYKTDDECLYLYKIHGSLNWIEVDDRIERLSVERHNETIKKFLVYPNRYGKSNIETPPFNHIFEEFERIMNGVDVLIVIGCSFRDKHVANIIRKMVDDGMHLITISPTSNQDLKRLFRAESPHTLHPMKVRLTSDTLAAVCGYIDDVMNTVYAEHSHM